MKVLVSTDTSCLVNNESLKKYDIKVFPLNVIIDGEEYLDGVTINQDQLKEAMRANKNIKTSTPPMGKVVEYFEDLFDEGYDQIIHFTISSKLSSMYSLFTTVSKNYFDGKIVVIDSYALSAVMLSQVLLAYEEVQKGTDIETICQMLEEKKSDNKVYFIPENLTALKNGGRISPAVAAVGNTIGLKPVLSLTDGELAKEGMTRHVKNAFVERYDEIIKNYPTDKYDYTLVHFDGKEAVLSSIENYLTSLIGYGKLVKGIVPINVCAHCGPGTIGIVCTPKINGKSLIELL